jgi:hypothetical protein
MYCVYGYANTKYDLLKNYTNVILICFSLRAKYPWTEWEARTRWEDTPGKKIYIYINKSEKTEKFCAVSFSRFNIDDPFRKVGTKDFFFNGDTSFC